MMHETKCSRCGDPIEFGESLCFACKSLAEPKQPLSSTPFRLDASHLYDEVKAFVLQQDEIGAPQVQRQFQLEWPQLLQFFTRLQSEGILQELSGSDTYKVLRAPSSSETANDREEIWRKWNEGLRQAQANERYTQVKNFVLGRNTVTPYLIRHQFNLTESQAQALLAQLESEGIVSEATGNQPRKVNLYRQRPPATPSTPLPRTAPPSPSPQQPSASSGLDNSSSSLAPRNDSSSNRASSPSRPPVSTSSRSTSSVGASSYAATPPYTSNTASDNDGCARGCEQGFGFGCGCLMFILFLIFGLPYVISLTSSPSSSPSSSSSGIVSQSRFTLRQYNTLQTGMSYRQAASILGAYGTEMARNSIGGYETVAYGWSNSDGSNINLTFQNDQLVQKAQAGLY